MFLVRILLGLLLAYAVLVLLAWVFQERIAFPAPRGPVPDPRQVGAANGERIELVMRDGTKLAGWYLAPRSPTIGRPPWPALLWFRSEEHTSELQSRSDLVCRLLLEKKNTS